MEENKKVSMAVVILDCICAVLWVIIFIINFTHEYKDSVQLVLQFMCAVCWSFVTIINVFRYYKFKKNNK